MFSSLFSKIARRKFWKLNLFLFLTLKNFRLDGSSLLEFLDDQDEYKPKIYGNIEDWASGPKNKSFD